MVTQNKNIASKGLQIVQTGLMTFSTALVIGCFKFLWGINAVISAQQVTIENNKDNIARLQDKVEFLEKEDADHADRLTKIELSKNYNYGKNIR